MLSHLVANSGRLLETLKLGDQAESRQKARQACQYAVTTLALNPIIISLQQNGC